MNQRREMLVLGMVCTAFLALCLAYALLLPPYEGFDEDAHASYVSFLADRWQVPDFRTTPFDRSVIDTVDHLPRRYSSIPPFERNGGKTYGDFFNRTPFVERQEAVRRFWQTPLRPAEYVPAPGTTNWQGQHPPLYYALLSLPYRWTRSAAPAVRLLVLRLCSVLLACGSLVFWWKAVHLFESAAARRTIFLGGVAILFFPSCWFDFARLGNDSLVALWTSAAFYFALRAYRDRQASIANHWGLAVVSGLGLLTKAFFLPISLGLIGWLTWQAIADRQRSRKAVVLRLLILIGIPFLLAGPWYGLCWQRYGSPLVTCETYYWSQPGAAQPGQLVAASGFAWGMLRATATFTKSFVWASSWSYVGQPLWHYLLGVPLILLAARNTAVRPWKTADRDARQIMLAAACALAPLMANFVHYMYLKGRFAGFQSSIGGYYLFAAWLPLAALLGRAFADTSRRGKVLLLATLAMMLYVEVYGIWLLAQTYAGVVEKLGNATAGVGFLWPTPRHLSLVYTRLRELAFPGCAAGFYALAWAVRLALVGLVLTAHDKHAVKQ